MQLAYPLVQDENGRTIDMLTPISDPVMITGDDSESTAEQEVEPGIYTISQFGAGSGVLVLFGETGMDAVAADKFTLWSYVAPLLWRVERPRNFIRAIGVSAAYALSLTRMG